MCCAVLFGLGVVMLLFAQQHAVLYFGQLRPESILFIHTIKLWLGSLKWKKNRAEAGSVRGVDGLMFRGIFGPFSVAQKAFKDAFPPASKDRSSLAQSPAVCGSQAEMEKQTHTHTHPHTPSLAAVWILEGRR